jgi:phosphoribosylglycinamide formyltransferase-1
MTAQTAPRPLPVAVLISGGGTTLRNLLEKIHAGLLDIEIRLVISSNPQAGGLAFAAQASIPALVLPAKRFPAPEAYRDAVFGPCREVGVELVVMGGFLKHLLIPPDFENRVINIHPALIPAFCGQGFYGQHVHQSVFDYGCKVSGCTVHFADNQYDHGPIILQRTVPVLDDDTSETLAQRVFEQECEAYPEAIRLFAEGRLRIAGRRVLRVGSHQSHHH